jgi:hypothetical protein
MTYRIASLALLALLLIGGCSKSPGSVAEEFITANDQGRTADAAKLIDGGTTMISNLANTDPWIARPGEPTPNWVDHVTVTQTKKVEKETYGEDLEVVDCDVTPKNGGPTATAEFHMKKNSSGNWIIFGTSTSNVPPKKYPYP